ncbi:MAG: hypothetical protein ABIG93_00650 [archaeon]
MNKQVLIMISFLIFFSCLASAATLEGTIYNDQLEVESNVLVEINTVPEQKMLAVNGEYSFSLPVGTYQLTAQKEGIVIREIVEIVNEGTFILDLFLLPDFINEDELWGETEEQFFTEEEFVEKNRWWAYLLAAVIFLFAMYRIVKVRLQHGSLRKFRRKQNQKMMMSREDKIEVQKTVEDSGSVEDSGIKKTVGEDVEVEKENKEVKKTIAEHREEIAQEPGYLEEVISIIKKHDGRISQKELRQEMMHLSEAKVSLIITELEHKGKIEKVKKGRGNVLLLRQ